MGEVWTSCCVLLAALCGLGFGLNPNTCEEVRKVFQLRQIGPIQLSPLSPRAGSDLQVCSSKNLTCCTKKMEEKYQVAARRDIQNLLQMSSTSLKFLISRNVAAFQETFELLMRHAENHTIAVLQGLHHSMADQAAGPVRELFTDISLFLLGSELSVDELVQRFFDALFPVVYSHLINPGPGEISPGYAECVRSSRRDVRPFGGAPGLLADQIARSGVSGKLLLQALHLGIEVINTTDHLQLSRECRRALLKMHYCPHCQGLTESKPCMGYCLNVMRGCLASMAEIDAHWREFVHSLEGLSARMQGPQDLEQVLLGVHALLRDAVGHAQKSGPRLSAQVHKLCGTPSRKPTQLVSIQLSSSSSKDSVPLKAPVRPLGDSLAVRRRDFLSSMRHYRTYYGGLADQLCVSELVFGDGQSCWNGTDIVKSYTLRVVGNGIKAQSGNPEVKVKDADPVINQIIDKLKHINQLLQGKSIPKLGSLDQIETGSGDGEGRYSGDCDDEDGCGGSGGGDVKRKVSRVSKMSPDVTGDHRHHHHYHHPPVEDSEMEGRSRALRLTGAVWVLMLPCLHMLPAL
ncbi:glypican-5a [Pleuronectes platessa]|uniref:glypican-5a n=1 Tax=Pleuronectes platessa TaxID=8262 RepID=UPI00232A78B2|nr:glypican-5a [Pleuronectes platessa]